MFAQTRPAGTPDGCVISGRLSKLTASGAHHDGSRAGPDRGLVPAVRFPLRWGSGVRGRRGALRERRGRSELQLRRLRPGRRQPGKPHSEEPVRGPARRGGSDLDAADGRGRSAAFAGLAHERGPGQPRRDDTARGPRTPAPRMPGNPLIGQRRPQRPTHRGLRAAQPVPDSRSGPARTRCGWATWAGAGGRR